jgi:hypothetical protein
MLAAALFLLEKYHSITERIMFLRFAQQGRKIALKIFIEGCRSS